MSARSNTSGTCGLIVGCKVELGHQDAFPVPEWTREELCLIVSRAGAWLRRFQEIETSERRLSLDGMREYIDVRLRMLVASGRAGFSERRRSGTDLWDQRALFSGAFAAGPPAPVQPPALPRRQSDDRRPRRPEAEREVENVGDEVERLPEHGESPMRETLRAAGRLGKGARGR